MLRLGSGVSGGPASAELMRYCRWWTQELTDQCVAASAKPT